MRRRSLASFFPWNEDMSQAATSASLPPWRRHDVPGLMGALGPLLSRREQDGWTYALEVREAHLNQAGIVHGGTVAALLDHALSTIAWSHVGKVPCVTVQLNVSFSGSSRAGQLLIARGRVDRETGTLLFLTGSVYADDTLVGTAQAVMKPLRGAAPDAPVKAPRSTTGPGTTDTTV
jgi:uncharacterized protein (TIGR00369 family)